MAVRDFVISFFASSPFLRTQLNKLQSNYLLFEPQVSNRQYKEFVSGAGGTVLGLWNKARAAGDELGRVAVLGFSEGCQGVSATLDCPDASTIDVVIPVDGIHRQFTDPITKAIYALLGRIEPNAASVACALGILGMVLLTISLLVASKVLGKKMGQLFRAG